MTTNEQNKLIQDIRDAVADYGLSRESTAKVELLISEFEKNSFYIDCLHMGGVDNWEWYGDSLEPYWKKYG